MIIECNVWLSENVAAGGMRYNVLHFLCVHKLGGTKIQEKSGCFTGALELSN